MDTLMDSTSGAYRVVTEASTYLIDLDRGVLRRLPRTGNEQGSLLRRGDELITILNVIECTVGRAMKLMIDLHVVGVPFTMRMSTPVVSIERTASPGERHV